ncbi:MAG: DUF192 domain-containing protein [Bacilli bacterium]|nr:DUF192 domain-containing protein [Bacilli bacterium]
MKLIVDNKEFNLVIAKSFFKKLKGLMFQKEIKENLIFIHCSSIHTFFMKRNIDILFFDKDKNLLEIHKDVKKNKIIICKHAYYTIELLSNKVNLDKDIKLI